MEVEPISKTVTEDCAITEGLKIMYQVVEVDMRLPDGEIPESLDQEGLEEVVWHLVKFRFPFESLDEAVAAANSEMIASTCFHRILKVCVLQEIDLLPSD